MSRHFPNWLHAYMDFTRNSEAPDSIHFWCGVSCIAGVLRRRVWIEESTFQIVPNFYVIIVAPPGIATKSTSADMAMRLLRRVDGVFFGPNSMTWQALTVALEESCQAVEYQDRILQMSCLTVSASELGVFLKTKDDGLIDVLTEMWDGKQVAWEHRTKTAHEGQKTRTQIVNPWMNILGCTTPAWMRRNCPAYIIEGGLTSRCVFIFANKKRQLVAYPHKIIDHQKFLAMGDLLVEDLNQIAQLVGEFHLTPEAEAFGEEWYKQLWDNFKDGGVGDRYSGYMSRKQGHIHKLAMVISAAQRSDLVITLDDIQLATRLVTSLEVDMNKMFESVGVADSARQTTDILQQIRLSGSISYKSLWQLFLPYMSQRDFDQAVKSLTAAGHIIHTENERKELFLLPFGSGVAELRKVVH